MRVTILGSGTAIPDSDRFPAGVLVEADNQVVLVDAGPGILRRLAAVGRGPEHLTAVLLTHFHTDHCADIPALLFALRNARYAGRSPILLAAAPGLDPWLRALTSAWPWVEPRTLPIQPVELAPGPFGLGALRCRAERVEHTEESLAYRLESTSGATVALSGDADECPGLVAAARDVDLFVCDAAYPDARRSPGHLTPGSAGRHAELAGARTLCLTHFYPECEGHDLIAEARATYSGRVCLAHDLRQFDLP